MSSMVGTPLYMSPQILDNKKYTNKTDIWSLGFIFFETLFGKSSKYLLSMRKLLGLQDHLMNCWRTLGINLSNLPQMFPMILKISWRNACKWMRIKEYLGMKFIGTLLWRVDLMKCSNSPQKNSRIRRSTW